jgi:hypothetical protein
MNLFAATYLRSVTDPSSELLRPTGPLPRIEVSSNHIVGSPYTRKQNLEGIEGIEPSTRNLTGFRSATELHTQNGIEYGIRTRVFGLIFA